MSAIRLSFLLLVGATVKAEEISTTVLASLDRDRIVATGMQKEIKSDMPDFTITYLMGPKNTDSIGVYEGGHPTPFGTRGKRLGEVKDIIAGQSVIWTCWSQIVDGQTRYGAETFFPSKRTVVSVGEKNDESVEQFHLFIYRGDLKALAAARKLAAEIIRAGPNSADTASK